MSTEKVTFNVDQEIWDKFINGIEGEVGKISEMVEEVITDLIKIYIDEEITMDNNQLIKQLIEDHNQIMEVIIN